MTNISEPEIVSYGRQFLNDYTPQEYTESLYRAFIDNRVNFVVLDSFPHGQRFLSACIAWALDQNYIYHERDEDDGQSKVSAFRLTERGRNKLNQFK